MPSCRWCPVVNHTASRPSPDAHLRWFRNLSGLLRRTAAASSSRSRPSPSIQRKCRRALDDRRERHALGYRVQAEDHDRVRDESPQRETEHDERAGHGAHGVRARVTEHAAFAKVVAPYGDHRAENRDRQARADRARRSTSLRSSTKPADTMAFGTRSTPPTARIEYTLSARPGRRSVRFTRFVVRAIACSSEEHACDVRETCRSAVPHGAICREDEGDDKRRRADADEFQHARRHAAMSERPEVTPKAAVIAVAVRVIDHAECERNERERPKQHQYRQARSMRTPKPQRSRTRSRTRPTRAIPRQDRERPHDRGSSRTRLPRSSEGASAFMNSAGTRSPSATARPNANPACDNPLTPPPPLPAQASA